MHRLVYKIAERSNLVSSAWWYWRTFRDVVEARLRFMGSARDTFLVPNRTISVPPSRIRRLALNPEATRSVAVSSLFLHPMRVRYLAPPIISGDWDLIGPLREDIYDDLRAVSRGARWDSTIQYAHANEFFERGEAWCGIMNRVQFEHDYCGAYDRLLESIERDGYMSQTKLRKAKPRGCPPHSRDEVTVAIGRDGSFLLADGRHRTAWATVLGVEEIPARVRFRHVEWAAFRKKLESYAQSHGGMVLESLLHPDLDNLPASRDCLSEFQQIRRVLGARKGSLVDLTPGWGYLCERFEQSGFDCTAIVDEGEDEWFLRANRRAQDSAFAVATIGDLRPGQSFDVALALDWTRRGLDVVGGQERLLELVKAVELSELVLEVPRRAAPQGDTAEHGSTLLASLAEKGSFAGWSLVGQRDSQTDLYRLSGRLARRPILAPADIRPGATG